MYQFIEEARECLEEYNELAEHNLRRDYLIDKFGKLLDSIETEYSNLEDKFHAQQRELKQYRNKYGNIR